MNRKLSCISALLFLQLSVLKPSQAHEYWLHPEDTQWRVGDTLMADIRNGDNFLGKSLPFNPDSLSRAGLISESTRRPLQGRSGDYPAFQMLLQDTGLHLLLLETTLREVAYEEIDEFEQFLGEHALTDVLQRHHQKSLPNNNIIEHYFRYCKSLVVVAEKENQDTNTSSTQPTDHTNQSLKSTEGTTVSSAPALQPQDQRLEIIMEETPLGAETLKVRVLFEGIPLSRRQVEIYHRDETNFLTKSLTQTDEEGYAQFSVAELGEYLVNTVWIKESSVASAHWVTFWASLFFQQAHTFGN